VLLFGACGGKAVSQHANEALSKTMAATNAARDSFKVWDKEHQMLLVERADDSADVIRAVSAYRERRAHVLDAFTKVYTVIGAAAALVPLVERGERRDLELTAALVEVVVAFDAVRKAIGELKE
jgi:hypothetical protein